MSNSEPPNRVAIVGGGITGLTVAWALQQKKIPYIILERGHRWGGKVITTHLTHEGDRPFVMEGGPESFVTRKPEVWQLACELGLRDEVVSARNEARNIFILTNGEPLELPLNPLKFITSRLLSWRGKLRLLAEPFIKPRRDYQDESLADFITRRLGREAEERLVSPILGGIYNANTRQQSIMVTSPVMRDMERENGGLIRGALARITRKSAPDADAPPARFIGFANGSQTLIDALTHQLTGDLRLNAPVVDVQTTPVGYELLLADGEHISAAAVVFATPANVTADILATSAPHSAQQLSAIQHNSLGTVSLIYRQVDLEGILPFSGVMIPRREGRRIDAITWTSRKDRERTPQGYEVLRVFYGGGDPATVTMPEIDLLDVVQDELRDLLGIRAPVRDYTVARWAHDYAQAHVGHLDWVEAIERDLPAGIFVTGASYRGLAVPDCIRQGRDTAESVHDYMAHPLDVPALHN